MVRRFFLLIHSVAVEDYELPKRTSHIISVPLTLECVRTLSWFISFSSIFIDPLMMFCDDNDDDDDDNDDDDDEVLVMFWYIIRRRYSV